VKLRDELIDHLEELIGSRLRAEQALDYILDNVGAKAQVEEVTEVRNTIWNLTDEMPMTRQQYEYFQVVKSRLWEVQSKLREAVKN